MFKPWQFKLTPPQFYFFLVVWTIAMGGTSVATIIAAMHVVTHAIIFPEFIGFNLATLDRVIRLMMAACGPLTLMLFYLKIFVDKVSLKLLRFFFIAQAFSWSAVTIFLLIQEDTRGGAVLGLILLCVHIIVLAKLRPFFERISRKRSPSASSVVQSIAER